MHQSVHIKFDSLVAEYQHFNQNDIYYNQMLAHIVHLLREKIEQKGRAMAKAGNIDTTALTESEIQQKMSYYKLIQDEYHLLRVVLSTFYFFTEYTDFLNAENKLLEDNKSLNCMLLQSFDSDKSFIDSLVTMLTEKMSPAAQLEVSQKEKILYPKLIDFVKPNLLKQSNS